MYAMFLFCWIETDKDRVRERELERDRIRETELERDTVRANSVNIPLIGLVKICMMTT